ncbi:MAG: cupin domain-containing protein [Chloroflexi bacterium]|nr:cupin domain-containing protein [Chloroflexota bacterium]
MTSPKSAKTGSARSARVSAKGPAHANARRPAPAGAKRSAPDGAGTRKWMDSFAEMLRAARAGRFTIEELAARSGVSSGRISQLERALGNPSFITLSRLAAALDAPVGSFFAGPAAESRMVVRKNERKRIVVPHDKLAYELLTPDLQRSLEVYMFHLPPRFDSTGQPITHRGEECIHVLSGDLEVHIEDQSFQLAEGDSITYDSGRPHFVKNLTERTVTALAAVTPPSF